MKDEPTEIVDRLINYVNILQEEKSGSFPNKKRIKGVSLMIYNALEKLRDFYFKKELSAALIEKIKKEKIRSGLSFPKGNYINICWNCHSTIDTRVDEICGTCEWVRCPKCQACKDPKFGGCVEYEKSRGPILHQ